MRIALLLSCCVLTACPGQRPVPDAGPMLPADQAWGPEGTPLPPGAVTATAEEVTALIAEGRFTIITKAGQDEKIAAEAKRHVDAKALVDGLEAQGFTGLAPRPIVAAPTVHPRPDGTVRVDVGDGGFLVHGTEWEYREIATSLAVTGSRSNREEDYRTLYDVLPDDVVAGLPLPDALAPLSDAALEKAHRDVTHLADTQLSNDTLLEDISGGLLSFEGSGCNNHQVNNLYALKSWPLKQYTTPVRDQGDRGSCPAFAAIGGMELRLKRSTGVTTNYSEQELWSVTKGLWFPTSNAFGDGANTGDMLDELKEGGGRIDAEAQWKYNRSLSRTQNEDEEKYFHSCDSYDGYCSDTNHQMKLICTPPIPSVFCGYAMPPGVKGSGTDPVKLKGFVSLWNPIEPMNSLASIRAHLNAGNPVTLGFELDSVFDAAASDEPSESAASSGPGAVNWINGGVPRGGHIVVVVGYISNGQLPDDGALGSGFGGGYLIAKNSWGCSGDGGYMYLSYDWVVDQAHSAFAITSVSSTVEAASGTLKTNKSALTSPGTVKLTVKANDRVRKVEIFGGLSSTTPFDEQQLPGGAGDQTVSFTRTFSNSQNQLVTYWARLTDQFGQKVNTNIVAVLVQIDVTDPAVTISAESNTVNAPGVVRLHATATDNTGVTKVMFLRGLQIIGEDYTAPYAMNHTVQLGDTGHQPYLAIAYDASGNHQVSNIIHVDIGWSVPPFVPVFSTDKVSLPFGGGPVTLTWHVGGASSVTIEPGLGTVASQGSAVVNLTNSRTWTLTATNATHTVTKTAFTVVAGQPLDQTPPTTVTLMASPTAVLAPGTTTLTSTAMDETGVVRVEFWRDGAMFASDSTPADGFSVSVSLTAADVGTVSFLAQAWDAAGNSAFSAAVPVTVTVNTSAGSYVGPGGSDTTDCRTEATPCRTLAYAAGQADGGVVILLDGTYGVGDQGPNVQLAGQAVVAKNPGLAVLAVPVFLNGGTISEVVIDRDLGANAGLTITGGNVTLTGVRLKGSFGSGAALDVSGSAKVTLAGGAAGNLAAQTIASNTILISVHGSSELNLVNGSLDGPGVGPDTSTTAAAAIAVANTATLKLSGFVVRAVNRAVRLSGSATLELDASAIEARTVSQANAWGVYVENNVGTVRSELATVKLTNGSRVRGFAAVGLRLASPALTHHPRATVTVTGSSIDQNGVGVVSDAVSSLTLTGSSAHLDDNTLGGLFSEGTLDLSLTSSSVNRNGTSTSATVAHFGGLAVPSGVAAVRLRRCEVKDNKSTVTNAATRKNAGLMLAGDRGSSFDLGRAADLGGNTITGNQTQGIDAAPLVRVYAVGNVFAPSVQGANAMGRYALGVTPCGATSCDVTSGVGLNYQVTNGALRLAE